MLTARLLLVVVGCCWASTPAWVWGASAGALETAAIRAAISGGLLLFFLLLNDLRLFIAELKTGWPQQLRAGILGAISTGTFATAFLFAPPGNVYVLYYTFPFISIGVDFVRTGTVPKISETVCLMAAMSGLMLVLSDQTAQTGLGMGELLGVISSLAWVVHIRASKCLSSEWASLSANALGQSASALMLLPFVLSAPAPLSAARPLIGLGLTSTLALLCWSIAIRRVPGHVAGVITMLEAPLGVLLMSALGIDCSGRCLIGGAVVISAAAYLTLSGKR